VFIDPPADGITNMAVDEALLDQAADEGLASLRFYQWREPTLSLGYFQAYAERAGHAASSHVRVVRRLSGGGALMHDLELTYAVCLPRRHPLSRQSAHLYGVAHSALIEALAGWGISARLYEDVIAQESAGNELASPKDPFLCFARRSAADIVATAGSESVKIVGSAQRRRRGAVLQHGAFLLAASRYAPELPGLHQVTGVEIDVPAIISAWCDQLAQRLDLIMIFADGPSPAVLQNRQPLLEKYASPSWTARR
jgi:lipoate-protein ligase A